MSDNSFEEIVEEDEDQNAEIPGIEEEEEDDIMAEEKPKKHSE